MKISRRFTKAGQNVYDSVEWTRRTSRISNSDGSTVFEMRDAEVPAEWSQLATDIVVSKYFRKAGVPRNAPFSGAADSESSSASEVGSETSVRQVVHRLAGCWQHWGERFGYFSSRRDAEAFYDELAHMLLHQVAAPNSPQWFNTGLSWAYGISGPAQGHWIADHATGRVSLAADAYSHPQPHACFIQAVRDDLVGEGGIMDLWVREARLFKYGSGTGTNFSSLRGEDEPLSGGGKSSGLMSFLKIGDRAAGAIKSGGTTRRAAKMVCLDVDHPDIEAFVNWKVREELKVAALVEGIKHLSPRQREVADRLGLRLDYDFNGEAYYTVSGQNSNNSVRVSDAFMDAVEADGDWSLVRRTDGVVSKTMKARELWDQITSAAWHCADPGVQFDSTINAWHTCPAGGRINASNPCSEYMFLDNTACNLASINLLKFYDSTTRTFDVDGFEHAIGLWTIVLEISVLMASFPSREIADLSWRYRTLGLGYANLGALLMQAGVPYDSDAGRALCGMLTAILTGRSYATSALLAAEHGPFAAFDANRDAMLRVMRNHRRAAHGVARDAGEYESLKIRPVPVDHALVRKGEARLNNADALLARATAAWDDAVSLGEKFGYRNAQTTVIAPTGTIGLLMDCDTTGVEPDFALTKFKKLAGGGYFKIANQSLRPALVALGYGPTEVDTIVTHVMGSLSLDVPVPLADGTPGPEGSSFRDWLLERGYSHDQLVAIENVLPTVFELGFAFTAWSMPDTVLRRLDLDPTELRSRAGNGSPFNGLRALGLTARQVKTLNRLVCGTQTVEGAPSLKDEHLPVFDCANRCGPDGKRFIRPEGHIRMMAACQPFISGAISKTINLPHEASVDEIGHCYRLSWELGLKANALYRDGSKLSQPLSTKSDVNDEDADAESAAESEIEGSSAPTGATPVAGAPAAGTPGSKAPNGGPAAFPPPAPLAPKAEAEREVTANTSTAEAGAAARDVTSTSAMSSAGIRSSEPAPSGEDDSQFAHEPVYVERVVERVVERIIERPMRRRLPDTRESITHKFNVAGHEGYLIVGLYEDGRPGELFITMAKEGSTIGGLMDSLGTAISVALQYGVPVESLVTKFAHQRFEPMGMTTNRDIPFAKSLVDYIFRWLGMQFIDGYREQNAPKRSDSSINFGSSDNTKEGGGWSGRLHESPQQAVARQGPHPSDDRRRSPRELLIDSDETDRPSRADAARGPTPREGPGSTASRDGSWSVPSSRETPLRSRSGAPDSDLRDSESSAGASARSRSDTRPSAAWPSDAARGGGMIADALSRSSIGSGATIHDRTSTARNPRTTAEAGGAEQAAMDTPSVTTPQAATPHVTANVTSIEASAVVLTESLLDRTFRAAAVAVTALDQSNANLMGDAPACDSCGAITVRNGTCYRCLNCGNSMGCS